MSRKRNAERALAEQQAEGRKPSSAHRSLVRRQSKRAAAASAAADDAPTEVTEEASTDTIAISRVPEFLSESETPETVADAEAADAVADEAVVEQEVAEPAATEDAEPAVTEDAEPTQVEDAAPDARAVAEEDAPAYGDDEPAYQPVYEPASAQDDTVVMAPIVTAATYPDTNQAMYQETRAAEPVGRQDSGDGSGGTSAPKKRRKWPWVVLVLVLIGAVGYYALATYYGSRVPPGTEALGVDIGGLDVATATESLNVAAAAIEAEPITLTTEGDSATLIPSAAGLSIDTGAMVEDVVAFTLNPMTVLSQLAGGNDLKTVVVVDKDAMDAAMKTASVQLDTVSKNASIEIVGATATAVPGTPSVTLEQDDTAKRIESSWPEQTEIEAITTVTEAKVPDHEADRTVATLNSAVFASAVTLTGPNGDVVLEPEQFAEYISTTPSGSKLEIVADGPALTAALREADPELENDATDAELSFDKNHKLVTKESEPGRALDDDDMGPALVDATLTVDHTGPLAYEEVHPDVSTENLGIADLKEIVSSFSTPLTAEPVRTRNLIRGAEKVTGVVILPNENFDLTEALSPITLEEGYAPAHVIVDGILTNGVGGGLSQMATTTYNAGYFAGYEDIQHRPHSKYFERYPAGRESTIYTGQINMVFKNNTPYAAVMSSYVKNNRLYVDIWSTPFFTVKTEASPRTNIVKTKTVTMDTDNCEPSGGGSDGFTISNTRTVFLDGDEVDKTTNTWTYLPDNRIVCE